ncbi:hypothetical protein N7474_006914 [Penicillium riverlandense]|uniref:uncharacterized protein n=1 Tax=Penicillium riverlandense TaxID=1903569 RepID=UPI002549A77F|nr:uncharacterized protein N7474_006914 [Penicillium riverlandense]KAJ5815137.1 hypothetical protein N7474_006914 [Penicillium riverlandense]
MSQFPISIKPELLREKVIIVTGGSNGIGASFVKLCCGNGAYVCFGDVALEAGRELERECNHLETGQLPRTIFCPTDVTDYSAVVALFDCALQTYHRIDHVVSCAGIGEIGNLFDPKLNLESIRTVMTKSPPPERKTLDVNLLGCIYVTRIALVYLRQNRRADEDRSIVLVSSVAGFKESPGIFVYQASKHGVIGLMRSLRRYTFRPDTHNIRINTVCPWMTQTAMTKGIEKSWLEAKLPVNTPTDVARIVTSLFSDSNLNGKSIYVEGGRGWEIEDNLDRLEPQWLGEAPSVSLNKGQEVLGDGSDWTTK